MQILRQTLDALIAIGAIIVAIGLAIFGKRYSEMKKREVQNRVNEVENAKRKIVDTNDDTSLDELIDRENASARRRRDS